jgi:RNA polymerase-binding transcription factor DksA
MATKKNNKKAAPAKKSGGNKKVAPKKKVTVKKPVKKSAPKKKAAAKKPVKKVAPKKPVKKVVAPKKAVKKVAPKKPVAKKPVKKAEVKKAVVKSPAKKEIKKPEAKVVKPVKKEEKKSPVKAEKVIAKKEVKAPEPKVEKAVVPEPKKPEMRMAAAKPRKEVKESSSKKSFLSQPTDIKMFANLQKTFKIPVTKPNIMKVVPVNTDTRSRYSDAELAEFKAIILGKLEEARKDLEMLRGSLSHNDDHGTDDTSPTFKMMEDGSETLSREETAQLAGRQEKFIMALENALLRIQNKTYGICRVTGRLISKDRLKLVPHTTLSIEAKNMQD